MESPAELNGIFASVRDRYRGITVDTTTIIDTDANEFAHKLASN